MEERDRELANEGELANWLEWWPDEPLPGIDGAELCDPGSLPTEAQLLAAAQPGVDLGPPVIQLPESHGLAEAEQQQEPGSEAQRQQAVAAQHIEHMHDLHQGVPGKQALALQVRGKLELHHNAVRWGQSRS
jgi:hypothetical protein